MTNVYDINCALFNLSKQKRNQRFSPIFNPKLLNGQNVMLKVSNNDDGGNLGNVDQER